jgi:malonate transporter MadM subunit
MDELLQIFSSVFETYSLVTAFAFVGLVVYLSYVASAKLTRGRVHGSAIAIAVGLLLSFWGGVVTGGTHGVADFTLLAGVGVMGGAMLRDLAIVATAFGVSMDEFLKTGISGILALLLGIFISFFVGGLVGYAFGYRDAVSLCTIGAGTSTYIVGPVTASALGASSEVEALSIAIGLIKSVLVMTLTPFVAPLIGLRSPRAALIFGGLMGTTSGVAGGLAATDVKLVPYGAMTATFYTGLACLLGPSFFFFVFKIVCGVLGATL